MKKLLFLLILIGSYAHGAALETYIDRRNASNSQTIPITIPVPISDCIYFYDKATFFPRCALVGSGIVISSGVVSAGNIDASHVTTGVFADFRIPLLGIDKIDQLQHELDLRPVAGSDVDWSQLVGFNSNAYLDVGAAAASHGHIVNDLSDATIVGKGVLTAASQSAARIAIGAEESGEGASAKAYSVQRANHTGSQSADTLTDGETNKAYLASERAKLANIANNATQNDTDANLKSRANHTGTQSADTLTDGGTNRLFSSAEKTKLALVDIPASGNASASQLVKGNDTRLGVRYSGATNASGIYAVTYPVAYATVPNVIITVVGGTNKDSAVLTSTVSGFSVLVERRSDVLGLLPTYAPVTPASSPSATVNVLVSAN